MINPHVRAVVNNATRTIVAIEKSDALLYDIMRAYGYMIQTPQNLHEGKDGQETEN